MRIYWRAPVLLLTACTTSTGPVPTGKDTYMIAIGGTSVQSGGTLNAEAFQEHAEFCKSQGKEHQRETIAENWMYLHPYNVLLLESTITVHAAHFREARY